MRANDKKSYFSYLNKFVDQCNNTYHHSIAKKPVSADCSALNEKIKTNPKAPKFKVNDRLRIIIKGYTKNWSRLTLGLVKLNI